MRVVCISDTHEQHRNLKIPDGDLLIHAGDITYSGDPYITGDFIAWLMKLPHKQKVFIAGNHDFWFERNTANPKAIAEVKKFGVIQLNDEGFEFQGLKIWGSPITPTFGNWAFMKDRGDEITKVWEKIPLDTDILITHGPPMGILDKTPPKWGSKHAGCWDLLNKVLQIKPKVHVFGHIHHGYGSIETGGTIFVNASSCDENYDAVNPPIVVEI